MAKSLVLAAGLAVATLLAGHAAAQQRDRAMAAVAEIPLAGDDGQPVANHAVKLLGPIDKLPGVVTVGNPNGKTTLVEFYDLNCPYCRIASSDIADMVDLDRELKLVLVPFPVLGIPSIAASRVELAVAKLGTPQQFYAFHRKVYAQRGVTDGARALEIAHSLGLDIEALAKLGDSDEITETMKAHVRLGDSLGLAATPAFIIDGVGSPPHMLALLFRQRTETQYGLIPYRGAGPAMQDVIAGQIDATFITVAPALPQIAAGNLKVFGITAPKRMAAAADIPTMDEAGLPNFYFSYWSGLYVPRGTPPDVVRAIGAAAAAAMNDPQVRQKLDSQAFVTPPADQQTAQALAELQRAEIAKWWPVIKAAGIKAD